ncbi:MAG: PstS family phosphate ABC transporter substrate-binding protein [Micrococcales bacterium]|nr:PstS family phosphate ABC transporter substrate-binding protein [Micrococcales bacterium]
MKVAGVVCAGALTLAACGGSNNSSTESTPAEGGNTSGSVRVDGSSTVAPLTSAAAELFKETNSDINVTVGTSGTGGGFEKFCRGETDMNDASREIEDDEAANCKDAGVDFQEMVVANDALTVVVNPANDFVQCLTVEQLNRIWEPKSEVNNWNQVDPSFPDEEIKLFGPGTDSGTFDYFTDAINGEEGASRTDYTPSEDDNVIVTGVSGSTGGMGYFGYTYYEENQDKVKAVQIDNGDGCVTPSPETVQDGSYAPLGRPLFIYPSVQALGSNPAFASFLQYYVENDAQIAEQALFIPLNDEQAAELQSAYADAKSAAGLS